MIEQNSRNSLLETAWRRFAILDENSLKIQKQYMRMRFNMAGLGILAVLFAILVDNYSDRVSAIVAIFFRVLLILTPIVLSIFAAFSNKFQQGQKYLSYRAAAEGILKEIYTYRVANQNMPNRDKILSERLAAIQRDLFRGAGGELVLTEYTGSIPPYHDPDDELSDPGLNDLTGEEYLAYRLENQLNWHNKKNLEMQRDRKRIQWSILIFGGVGAFLAAWGGDLAIWVAFTAAIASALVGWEELRGLDMRVGNYSQVILELNIIRDWWFTLRPTGASDADVAKLTIQTEKVLYDQNLEWISAMRKALAEVEGDEAKLVEEFVEEGRAGTARIREKLFEAAEELTEAGVETAVERAEAAIDDAAGSLQSMFAGLTAIDEEELDLPPEESFDTFETITAEPLEDVVASTADELYTPVPEPDTVENAVDAAIAESTIFSNAVSEEPQEEFADEDFGEEHTVVADDNFVDEDFGEADEDEFGNEADFIDELWDDEL